MVKRVFTRNFLLKRLFTQEQNSENLMVRKIEDFNDSLCSRMQERIDFKG